ncbi:MAG: hypothetical protein K6G84_09200 [Lachnospiraceae bacterium]|nr:hypothetical protein [Lachnospiraceae bacterium]
MGRRSIVEQYSIATMEKRIEIILDNYSNFTRMLDGYVESLSIVIRNEREYNRSVHFRSNDIRVQTSNISDITSRIAIENVSIQEAINTGDADSALKGTDMFASHRWEIETICMMRDDYIIVNGALKLLRDNEYNLYISYLNRKKSCIDFVEETGITYEGIRSRLYRCRNNVKKMAVEFMTIRSKNYGAADRYSAGNLVYAA